jgi:hypothetical protein
MVFTCLMCQYVGKSKAQDHKIYLKKQLYTQWAELKVLHSAL